MIDELEKQEVEALLRRQHLAHLGVRDAERVYVYPVAYGYDGTDIYVQSSEGLKVDIMRGHPEVCLQVEEVMGPARWWSVMVHGTYAELVDESARDRAFAVITEQSGLDAPPSLAPYARGPEQLIAYRIHPTEITGRIENDLPLAIRPHESVHWR
jgi:uncharacterized protein